MDHTPPHDHDSAPAPHNSYGSVLSIVLMVLVIVFGAFYVWHKRIASDRVQPPVEADEPIVPAPVNASTTTEML